MSLSTHLQLFVLWLVLVSVTTRADHTTGRSSPSSSSSFSNVDDMDVKTSSALSPSSGDGTIDTAASSGSMIDATALPPTSPPSPSPAMTLMIPKASPLSRTFRKVPSLECDERVATKLLAIYQVNHETFNLCAAESKYQIFPYSGSPITNTQLRSLVNSRACRGLAMACVVANFPQCDTSGLPLKAVVETLLTLMVDVEQGVVPLDALSRTRFRELYVWRRDVNLARAARVPFGAHSPLYEVFTQSLLTALADPRLRVTSNLAIQFLEDDEPSDEEADGNAAEPEQADDEWTASENDRPLVAASSPASLAPSPSESPAAFPPAPPRREKTVVRTSGTLSSRDGCRSWGVAAGAIVIVLLRSWS